MVLVRLANRLTIAAMRTYRDCIAKAVEMEVLALTGRAIVAADYRRMAVLWRELARQAEFQDGFQYFKPSLIQ
jgi:hypothetical protein